MQPKYKDGTYGDVEPFSEKRMEKTLSDENVEHVEVFNDTPAERARREGLTKNERNKKTNRKKNKASRKSRKKNRK